MNKYHKKNKQEGETNMSPFNIETRVLEERNHTTVLREEKSSFVAPHYFEVQDKNGNLLGDIHFQEGAINEVGVNGVQNEDLLLMVIERLKKFQSSQFSCHENQMALNHLEEAYMWLEERTRRREKRGVEGTRTV